VESRCWWGFDPASGQYWPMDSPPHQIDYRQSFSGLDIKIAWEHLKLQHLQLLAYAVAIWDEKEHKEALRQDICHWLENTRPFRGIGYASGIECALRVMSLLVIFSWVGDSFFAEETKRKLWQRLHDLYHWIKRYPSLHSSANNHRVAELSVVFILELLVPEWREGNIAHRSRTLQDLLRSQFYDDGVNKEQSLYYQALVTEWMLILRQVCAGRHVVFELDDLLEKSGVFLHHMLDADGTAPNIGDADDSLIIRSHLEPENYVQNICFAALCVTEVGGAIPTTWTPSFREVVLDIQKSFGEEVAKSTCFAIGGYTVFRQNGVLLVFDHGPIGFPPLPGHGHSDALSIWLHVNDVPLLIDSGTGQYNLNAQQRSWFRGTRAHNTICVNGQNQSLDTGPFNWGDCAEANLNFVDVIHQRASASHDGYLSSGVMHHRQISMNENDISIVDRLDGEGQHYVEIPLHFSSLLQVDCTTGAIVVILNNTPIAHVLVKDQGENLSVRNEQVGLFGNHSLHYNHISSNPCVVWSGTVKVPCSFEIRWVWLCHPREIWKDA